MKKIMLLLCLVTTVTAVAQNFPGKDVAMLVGKELRVLPLQNSALKVGYKGFYTDPQIQSMYNKGSRFTNAEALQDKVFRVISYQPRYCNYVLAIENPDTGVLYYDYHTYSEDDFAFEVVGGLPFPEGYFCDNIEIHQEWVSASQGYTQEAHAPTTDDICLCRTTDDVYKLKVAVMANGPMKKTPKGITLYLENGEELNFPDATIDVVQIGENYSCITNPRLRIEDTMLEKLRNNRIVRKKIGSYESDIEGGNLIQEYVKCLAK